MTKKERRAKRKVDLKRYRDFVRQYREGTLDGMHPVQQKVRHMARLTAKRFNCLNDLDDLEQVATLNLATKSDYEGKCSLDTYILIMMAHAAGKFRKSIVPGLFAYAVIDDDGLAKIERRPMVCQSIDDDSNNESALPLRDTLANEPGSSLAHQAAKIIARDEYMRRLAALPRIQQQIDRIIRENEGPISDRKLASELSEVLKRNVSRHEAKQALKRLRPIVEATLWIT